MKHIRFEENILVDESYSGGGDVGDYKKGKGIAKNFADSLEKYDERRKWYLQLPPEPAEVSALSSEALEKLNREANSTLHEETLAYDHKCSRKSSSEVQWARTLMKQGAIADRVAAATVLIQEEPLYNLAALRSLIASVKPAKKKDAIVAIDALSELFISDLLPPDQKLSGVELRLARTLSALPAAAAQRRPALALYAAARQLHELYAEYVSALNTFAQDSVVANREKAVSSMAYLLLHHPEKEKILLQSIVNKLGDPAQAVASKVIYHLAQILYNHPNMKAVMLAEIEKMLFRSNISPRAQYYGICFLNQMLLGKDDSLVAENLIRVYFSFFTAAIKKGEIDSRLMCAILTGVKRAHPFADRERARAASERHAAALQRVAHLAADTAAVHALALLYHISHDDVSAHDRYSRALYRKLASPRLLGGAHAALLLNLVYKTLRGDPSLPRVAAFTKRLLQLALSATPAHAAGILILISRVTRDSKKREALRLTLPKHEKEEIEEIKLESPLEKEEDTTEERKVEKGLSKEIVEEENSKCGVEEEIKEEKETVVMDLLVGDKRDLLKEESDEEYCDVKVDEEGREVVQRRAGDGGAGAAPGWHHARLASPPCATHEQLLALRRAVNAQRVATSYAPSARDPAHAGATLAAATELLVLAKHAHPTVRLFAAELMHGRVIKYNGDPLKDFSCIRFLERFSFKNPKQRPAAEPADAPADAQPGAARKLRGSHPKFAQRKNYTPRGLRNVAVTSSTYLNEEASKIPIDEMFLYDYLRRRREAHERRDSDSDADSVASEDFHEYLDTLSGAPRDGSSDEEGGVDWMSAVQVGAAGGASNKKKGAPEHSDTDDDEENAPESDDELAEDASTDDEELMLEESAEGAGAGRRGRNRQHKSDLSSLFASAEEFSTLLEETGGEAGQGTSAAAAPDRGRGAAARKQLAWEQRREPVRGKRRASGARGGGKRRRV